MLWLRYFLIFFFISCISHAQVVSTIAGGKLGYKDGSTDSALFNFPNAVAIDTAGNLFIADVMNHRIRKIDLLTNTVSTYAGVGEGYRCGNPSNAKFYEPVGITISRNGDFYVADFMNSMVRSISVSKQVIDCYAATSPENGYLDAKAGRARFHHPTCIVENNQGVVYVADFENHVIRRIYNDEVTTLAGNGKPGCKDGTGTSAQFDHPYGLALDKDGNIYVADEYNNSIRKITPSGQVSTVAGSKSGFKDGKISEALFNKPTGLVLDAIDNIYVADFDNHRIRKITPDGNVVTVAGSTQGFADGVGSLAKFNGPSNMAFDKDGNMYVADVFNNCIRKITFNTIIPSQPLLTTSHAFLPYGQSASLSIVGKLNSAQCWKIFKDECGGTAVGTTRTTISLYPSETTTYYVRGETANGQSGSCAAVTIKVDIPFWKTWWLICLVALFFVFISYLIFRAQLKRERVKRQLIEFESKALRAQMNPHFIFNALNSIQGYMSSNESAKAKAYLVRFARLIRKTLDNSRNAYTSLATELDVLKDYLELEKMRFNDAFDYSIESDNSINKDIVLIPPMLIQPFVENAVLHGVALLHDRRGRIHISFQRINTVILCVVEDNGIGRLASKSRKTDSGAVHESHGSKISAERIKIFQQRNSMMKELVISDKYEGSMVVGTKVEIVIPFELEV